MIATGAAAFIYAYVISGAIESKVNDSERDAHLSGRLELVRTAWRDPLISRNASKTEPAKLLAVFVLDTNDNPLTTPVK